MKALAATLISWGPIGVLILSTLDSAGIPLPAAVDVLITAVAALEPTRAYFIAALATLGSLAGSLFMFYLARRGGQLYLDKHTSGGHGAKFKEWFRRYGLITIFIPALLPIPLPLKVFILCAGAIGVSYRAFALVLLAARIPRYFGLAYLGAQLGQNTTAWLRQHSKDIIGFALLLVVVLVLLVKISERFHRRPA
jgi:membrane protein DedA with SNARE-associated domain